MVSITGIRGVTCVRLLSSVLEWLYAPFAGRCAVMQEQMHFLHI